MILKVVAPEEEGRIKIYDDLRKVGKEKPVKKENGKNYFECSVPQFPIWTNKTLTHTDKYKNQFKINLYNLTCTCSDFREKKSVYKNRDIRICCVHIYYKLSNTAASKCVDPLTLLFIHSSSVFSERLLYKYQVKGKNIYLGFSSDNDWVNVYSPNNYENGIYIRYSFNPITVQWSYGAVPPHSMTIQHNIKTTIDHQLTFEHKLLKIKKILEE